MSGTKFAVQKLVNEGWSPIPIPQGEKGPRISGWETQDFTAADFGDDDNIGVHLGKSVSGAPALYDVDIDDKLAVVAAEILLAPTDRIHGRPGKPRSHRFYTCDDQIDHYVIHGLGGNNDTIVELRGISPSSRAYTQTVVPPSVHPSGETLAWVSEGKPGHFASAAVFIPQVRDVGIAVLLARGFPGPGHRHDVRMAMAGYLFRAGLDELVIKAIGRAVMKMIGGDEQDWLDTCRTTIEKLKADPEAAVTGGGKLMEFLTEGEKIIKKINILLGRQDQAFRDEVLGTKDKRYFRVTLGTQPCVGDDSKATIDFYSYPQFRDKYIHERMPAGAPKDRLDKKTGQMVKGKPQPGEGVADFWLKNTTRRYDQFVYAPPPLVAGVEDYNGWKGFKIAPVEGPFPLIEGHVRDVVCGGDDALYEWVMNWCAALMQRPGQHAMTGIVLKGGQGVGKGFFAHDLLGGMFDLRHYVSMSSGEEFYGRFAGSQLSGRCLIFLDEAIWGGNKQHLGMLKSRVTGDYLTVDRKNITAVSERSMLHLVIATNEEWPIAVDGDDRRFTVLQVNNAHANRPEYFNPLYQELQQGGAGAFLHVLMNLPIDEDMLRMPYETSAKDKMKGLSIGPELQWWLECLTEGRIQQADKKWPKSVYHDLLATAYQVFMQTIGHHQKKPMRQLLELLERMCPAAKTFRKHNSKRELLLPSLDECRIAFEKFSGGRKIDWKDSVQGTLSDSEGAEDVEVVPF